MKRVVNLWLALLAAFWLARAGVSSLLFGRVDQGFPALVELLAIPALQAVALAWATQPGGQTFRMTAARLALPWRAAWRLRSLRAVLAVDAGVLALPWLVPGAAERLGVPCASCSPVSPAFAAGSPWPSPSASAAAALPGWVFLAKLLAAALLLLAAAARQGWRARDRLALGAAAIALLALAAQPWRAWLAALPGLLTPLAGGGAAAGAPTRVGAQGALVGVALLLGLEAAAALRRRSLAAAVAADQAVCLFLAACACAAPALLRQPEAVPGPPWGRAAAALGSLCASALLVASALAWRASRTASGAAESVAPAAPAARAAAADPTADGPPPPYRRPLRRVRPAAASKPPQPPAPGGGPSQEPA
jgi:hypothetical protein